MSALIQDVQYFEPQFVPYSLVLQDFSGIWDAGSLQAAQYGFTLNKSLDHLAVRGLGTKDVAQPSLFRGEELREQRNFSCALA